MRYNKFLLAWVGLLSLNLLVACVDFQGSSLDQKSPKLAYVTDAKLWPDAVLVYQFDENFDEDMKHKVQTAANNISNETKIKVMSVDEAKDQGYKVGYVSTVVSMEEGCSAQVGYRPDSQVYLSSECPIGAIMHEFFHVLGVQHEQLNPRFQGNIRIDNVLSGKENNFEDPAVRQLTEHDRFSIMHYSSWAFSICTDPDDEKWQTIDNKVAAECAASRDFVSERCKQACATILDDKGKYIYTQSDYLSEKDKVGINRLYASILANKSK